MSVSLPLHSRVARAPRALASFVALLGAIAVLPPPAGAAYVLPDGFVDELVVGGFDQPVNLALLPDGRVFVVERVPARVRLIVAGAISPIDPVLTVDSVQTNNNERGLLGIALDPDWPARPYAYVYSNHLGGPWIRLSRFRAEGDLAFTGDGQVLFDPASRYDLLSHIPDVSPVHNGGSLRFGPDGMLYVAVGDDNHPCDALDLTVLRGKILRLDVRALPDGPGGNPPAALLTPADNPFVGHPNANARLVWARGLRNPYSFAIDPLDGALLIGDVGTNTYEEIDHAPAGGLNFQWPVYEGPLRIDFPCASVDSSAWTPPVHFYGRTEGQTVIAGVVYRRPEGAESGFPLDHEGSFFFADFYVPTLRRLVPGPGHAWVIAPPVPGQPNALDWGRGVGWVSAYLVGPDGAIYYARNWIQYPQPDGEIRRIRRAAVTGAPRTAPGAGLRLGPAIPNPASGPVRLGFELPRAAPVSASVHDVRGRLVRWLRRGETAPAGANELAWDGRDERGAGAPAGVFLVRVEIPGAARVSRVVRLDGSAGARPGDGHLRP